MSAPIKILFLHGYTQSGPSFHAKTRALEKAILKALPTGSSLHFPTAPHLLRPSDLPDGRAPSSSGDNWSWWQRDSAASNTYSGLDETWVFLSGYLATHGPFDGCVGFSQGAALAAMLASVLEPGRPRPASFRTSHAALKFAACYSGFRTPYAGFYEPAIATPVLHFLGSLDTVVSEARSMELVAACVRGEQRVVFHPGGHYLPAGRQYVGVLLGFVVDCVDGGDGKGGGKGKGEGEGDGKGDESVGGPSFDFPF